MAAKEVWSGLRGIEVDHIVPIVTGAGEGGWKGTEDRFSFEENSSFLSNYVANAFQPPNNKNMSMPYCMI